jgi:iron complex outermembrane receptor protein
MDQMKQARTGTHMKRRLLYSGIIGATIGAALLMGGGAAFAQSAPDTIAVGEEQPPEKEEVIIITGTRTQGRSVADSPVPVDVLSAGDIESVPFTDTNDILKSLVPSFAINRQPISDGGTFTRPAELRGLPTDKTLVLVNSKRRHRAALVEIGGSGTQGPDIATIPSSALKSVEVLRDGAAAQYGSDAIAGVINFILKDDTDGFSVTAQAGQYYEGDGDEYVVGANAGFALGENGFINISGEYAKSDATIRAEQYCEAWFCLDPNNPDYDATADYNSFLTPAYLAAVDKMGPVVQPWGQPNFEATRGFINAGYTLNDQAELYAFGNYSKSEGDGSFYYRYPLNGTIMNLRNANGSIYSPLQKYPGGFTPRFFGEIVDYSAAGGIRGDLGGGFGYDVSLRRGNNEIQYTLKNTINPSLGAASPQSFRPGDLINEETQAQADFTKEFDVGFATPLVVGFGLSYLEESYEIVEGELASYQAGPYATPDPFNLCTDVGTPTAAGLLVIGNGSSLNCADVNDPDDDSDSYDPVYQVVGVGSNGFPGYSPEFSGKYKRDSQAAYVDVSADITSDLFLQAALRYEDYSDFGEKLVWKLAGRYEFTDNFALRGSVGTGFRAPTPGQQGTTNVSTRLPEGFPVATGLFPASGIVAQALGAEPLKPETSTNYAVGFTTDIGDLTLTVDAYQIEIEDRVYATSTQDVSTNPTAGAAFANYQALVTAGVSGAESIGGVFFFQNAFDTVTRGIDVVATYSFDWSAGTTKLIGSLNYNESELDSLNIAGLLNEEDIYDFEHADPKIRGVLTATHDIGQFSLLGRANFYGEYSNSEGGVATIQEFDPEVLFDFEVAYNLSDKTLIAIGARNAFDEYPPLDLIREECCGALYRSDSVVDWQGGYYYLRARHAF